MFKFKELILAIAAALLAACLIFSPSFIDTDNNYTQKITAFAKDCEGPIAVEYHIAGKWGGDKMVLKCDKISEKAFKQLTQAHF